MRETYDRLIIGDLRYNYENPCTEESTVTLVPAYLGRSWKLGSSGHGGIRPDDSYPPHNCDLSRGEASTIPYTRRFENICGFPGGIPAYSHTDVQMSGGVERIDELTDTLVSQSVIDECVTMWYAKLADFRANLAADVATYRQTVDGVTMYTRKLAQAARDLRRGNMRGVKEALGLGQLPTPARNIASKWLELHFGWAPLVSDIYAILDLQSQRDMRSIIRKSIRRNGDTVVRYDDYSMHPKKELTHNYVDIVTVRAIATLKDVNRTTVSQFGLDNPAALAWELLPASFLVDWFVPVGPYLETLGVIGNFEITDASVTSTRRSNLHIRYYDDDDGFLSPGSYEGEGYRKVRVTGLPSLPMPSFSVPRPSLTRFASALALLTLHLRSF